MKDEKKKPEKKKDELPEMETQEQHPTDPPGGKDKE